VCQSVSESVTQNELNALLITDLTKLATKVESPGDVITFCFCWKSERHMSAKLEMGLIFTIAHMEK